MVPTSAWVLKPERIHSTSANTTKENAANFRGSNLDRFLPTSGDSSSAKIPTGASTLPASVAV